MQEASPLHTSTSVQKGKRYGMVTAKQAIRGALTEHSYQVTFWRFSYASRPTDTHASTYIVLVYQCLTIAEQVCHGHAQQTPLEPMHTPPPSSILADLTQRNFPPIQYGFAYGSGVFSQPDLYQKSATAGSAAGPMLDFVFVVDDPLSWHAQVSCTAAVHHPI